jgi:hypothetical protein
MAWLNTVILIWLLLAKASQDQEGRRLASHQASWVHFLGRPSLCEFLGNEKVFVFSKRIDLSEPWKLVHFYAHANSAGNCNFKLHSSPKTVIITRPLQSCCMYHFD